MSILTALWPISLTLVFPRGSQPPASTSWLLHGSSHVVTSAGTRCLHSSRLDIINNPISCKLFKTNDSTLPVLSPLYAGLHLRSNPSPRSRSTVNTAEIETGICENHPLCLLCLHATRTFECQRKYWQLSLSLGSKASSDNEKIANTQCQGRRLGAWQIKTSQWVELHIVKVQSAMTNAGSTS